MTPLSFGVTPLSFGVTPLPIVVLLFVLVLVLKAGAAVGRKWKEKSVCDTPNKIDVADFKTKIQNVVENCGSLKERTRVSVGSSGRGQDPA